ncbi:MAG: dipeptide epimerase [Nocardioidaceae bacterium]|nr:dipeptide epimerase [Nocardioidaceae bacterium]
MISAVRTRVLDVPLHTPFVTALRRTETTSTVLVEVEDADGVVGFGEAPAVWQVTGESLAGARACVDGPLASVLVGRDPDDLRALLHDVRRAVAGNHGAKAAVDVAVHDLVARRRGVPLVVLLGGTSRRVPTDVTLSVADAADLARTAGRRLSEGFTAVKVKVGTDAVADVERVRQVREAVGPDVAVRLDANQGWTPRAAVTAIGRMEDLGLAVELVEQPVAAADLAGLAWVSDHVGTPVMADETVFGLRDLVEVVSRRAADLVNVKLAKCGGLVPAAAMLELCAAHEVGTMVGTMMETHVGVGAAAALASAHGTPLLDDLDAAWWATSSPYVGGPTYDGPVLVLPDTPGLGVEGVRA